MTVFLHIGHSKTGTSALQSFFSINSDLLAEYGIHYPSHSSLARAAEGRISSGNLSDVSAWIPYVEEKLREYPDRHLLFSNEGLYGDNLLRDQSTLKSLLQKVDIKVILYIRDPYDHMVSTYGQLVKRGRETRSIEEFCKCSNIPNGEYDYVRRLYYRLNEIRASGLSLVVHNYSRCAHRLVDDFMEILIGERSMAFLAQAQRIEKRVNRSLSSLELEFQRQFNIHYDRVSAIFISDSLVDRLPNIEPEIEYISSEAIRGFIGRIQPLVEKTNAMLKEEHRMIIECDRPRLSAERHSFEISKQQIEVLATSISEALKNRDHLTEKLTKERDTLLQERDTLLREWDTLLQERGYLAQQLEQKGFLTKIYLWLKSFNS